MTSMRKLVAELQKNRLKSQQDFPPGISSLLALFAEKSQSVFWIRNAEGLEQLYISPSYERIWQRSTETLYQNPAIWFDALHPDDRSRIKSSQIATDNKSPKLNEYRCIRPNGEIRWIREESFPLYDDKNQLISFAGIAQDISEEKELAQAKKLAEVASHSKSEFLANMSHDLRTPLNWLLGAANILKKRNDDAEKAKLLEMILDGGKRILQMVEEILDYSKLESGKLLLAENSVNLRQVSEEVVNMLSTESNKKEIALILDYPDTVCRHIIGDRQRLRRIITNLLSNAIKFTHSGHVCLMVREKNNTSGKTQLRLQVNDTGVGIAAEKLPTIFNRFEKDEQANKNHHHGVGLGLAIVKKFVDAMAGEVFVEKSQLEQGTTFVCLLPVRRQQRPERPSFWQQHLQSLRVLVVDDLNERAQAYQQTLSNDYLDICPARTALEQIIKQPPYDVILIDDNLQPPCHLDLAEQIRAVYKERCPLLLLARRSASENNGLNAHSYGYFATFAKPLLPSQLTAQCSRAWLQQQAQSQSVLSQIQQTRPKVLLVEDEPFGQRIVVMLLAEELGCLVTMANNAEEALDSLKNNHFDLILMDIGLPDENGLQLTEKIRAYEDSAEQTPIVALTAHASDDMITRCQQAGMNGHLAKPAASEDLLAVIGQHVFKYSA